MATEQQQKCPTCGKPMTKDKWGSFCEPCFNEAFNATSPEGRKV